MKRRLIQTALAAVLSLSAGAALAQMNRLEMVAPGGPGSGQDQVARAVAEALQKEGIVNNVQVVNIAGGGGMVDLVRFGLDNWRP